MHTCINTISFFSITFKQNCSRKTESVGRGGYVDPVVTGTEMIWRSCHTWLYPTFFPLDLWRPRIKTKLTKLLNRTYEPRGFLNHIKINKIGAFRPRLRPSVWTVAPTFWSTHRVISGFYGLDPCQKDADSRHRATARQQPHIKNICLQGCTELQYASDELHHPQIYGDSSALSGGYTICPNSWQLIVI